MLGSRTVSDHVGLNYVSIYLGLRLWAEDFYEEEAGSDDDAGVGYVEVGPVVVDDADLEEVDDIVVADAVVEVAEGSAEDEGKGYGRDGEGTACAP